MVSVPSSPREEIDSDLWLLAPYGSGSTAPGTVTNGGRTDLVSNAQRQDGRRGVLISVLKAGTASTLSVVKGIRDMLPRVALTVPAELKMTPLSDQSIFVRAAVSRVIREA